MKAVANIEPTRYSISLLDDAMEALFLQTGGGY